MTSNYDKEIRSRVESINQTYVNHLRKVGRGATNMHTEDQLVDLSNLENIQPSGGVGRKITGSGRSGGSNCRKIGGYSDALVQADRQARLGTVTKQKQSDDQKALLSMTPAQKAELAKMNEGAGPSKKPFSPKPEDYLSKNELDSMTARDRANFKDHPDWWNVYPEEKQYISPSTCIYR